MTLGTALVIITVLALLVFSNDFRTWAGSFVGAVGHIISILIAIFLATMGLALSHLYADHQKAFYAPLSPQNIAPASSLRPVNER
jgi:hypothetical protein